eukprot:TRINITY_DN9954_c0_g1_i3.p1 TRINITY_DN9954_c0_g1~~TRINITY_DN9954_c0_g1_i3.p1  ORF type:complete len:213 (-),score=26.98 TRINITY_DN9954_c0_g1_i3:452-1009(-)
MSKKRPKSGNPDRNRTFHNRIPLGPYEPFSSAKESNLDKVFYRYPKGIATSYGASFSRKEPQKNIPFFNMNTYQRAEFPHKLDLKTINQLEYQNRISPLKTRQSVTKVSMPSKDTIPQFKSTYADQYPYWGKPEFYHFKHKEPRVTSDELAFHAETTYGKSYKKVGVKATNKYDWEDFELMYCLG